MANGRSEAALARNIRGAANAEALADAGVAQAQLPHFQKQYGSISMAYGPF